MKEGALQSAPTKQRSAPAAAKKKEGEATPWRMDLLLKFPSLKWLVSRRWFQFAVILPNLVFFLLFLTAGVFGTPVGNRNIIGYCQRPYVRRAEFWSVDRSTVVL